MRYRVERAGKTYELDVEIQGEVFLVREGNSEPQRIALRARPDGSLHATMPWGDIEVVSARRGEETWAHAGGRRLQARVVRARPLPSGALAGSDAGALRAPMAGRLLRVEVQVGDRVRAGQALAVIEAMKMENELLAPLDGVVTRIACNAPAAVDKGALLILVEQP